MRALNAIAAACLIGWALPATSQAGEPAADPGTAAAAAHLPPLACDEPGPGYRPAVRPHRQVIRRHVRHHRRWLPPPPVAMLPPPLDYNPVLPSPWDSAYDRAMTLHFKSPYVSGFHYYETGLPPTPPVAGIHPYRIQAGGVAFQYDGLTGQYVRLAPADATPIVAMLPPLPAPPRW